MTPRQEEKMPGNEAFSCYRNDSSLPALASWRFTILLGTLRRQLGRGAQATILRRERRWSVAEGDVTSTAPTARTAGSAGSPIPTPCSRTVARDARAWRSGSCRARRSTVREHGVGIGEPA